MTNGIEVTGVRKGTQTLYRYIREEYQKVTVKMVVNEVVRGEVVAGSLHVTTQCGSGKDKYAGTAMNATKLTARGLLQFAEACDQMYFGDWRQQENCWKLVQEMLEEIKRTN